jgi:hypothetical protein
VTTLNGRAISASVATEAFTAEWKKAGSPQLSMVSFEVW